MLVDKGVLAQFDNKLNNFKEAVGLVRQMKKSKNLDKFYPNQFEEKTSTNFNPILTINNYYSTTPRNVVYQHIENRLNSNRSEEKVINYKIYNSDDFKGRDFKFKPKSKLFPKLIQHAFIEKKAILRKDLQIQNLIDKAQETVISKENPLKNLQFEYKITKIPVEANISKKRNKNILTDLYNEFIGNTIYKKNNPFFSPLKVSPQNSTRGFKSTFVKKQAEQKKNLKLQFYFDPKKPIVNKLIINNSNKALDKKILLDVDNLLIPSIRKDFVSKPKIVKKINLDLFKKLPIIDNEDVGSKPDIKSKKSSQIYKKNSECEQDLSPWLVHED
jgi:hypothetical protein